MLFSLPSLSEFGIDFALDIKFDCCDSCMSNGLCYKVVVHTDHAIWYYLILKKDLDPVYLN